MIYVTGDIHGEVRTLLNWLDKCHIPHEKEQIIVLLGDVGVNYFGGYADRERKVLLQDSNRTYFCIHGNHEKRPESISSYYQLLWHDGLVYMEDEFPNLLFAKDGEVYDLEGLQTLVIGGAYSVDKWYRLRRGWGWWDDEQVSEEHRAEILEEVKRIKSVDLVLTHTCPYEWEPRELFLSGLDQSTVDDSMEHWLSEIEANLEYRYWLFGHFHGDKKINDKAQMLYKDVIDLEFLKSHNPWKREVAYGLMNLPYLQRDKILKDFGLIKLEEYGVDHRELLMTIISRVENNNKIKEIQEAIKIARADTQVI